VSHLPIGDLWTAARRPLGGPGAVLHRLRILTAAPSYCLTGSAPLLPDLFPFPSLPFPPFPHSPPFSLTSQVSPHHFVGRYLHLQTPPASRPPNTHLPSSSSQLPCQNSRLHLNKNSIIGRSVYASPPGTFVRSTPRLEPRAHHRSDKSFRQFHLHFPIKMNALTRHRYHTTHLLPAARFAKCNPHNRKAPPRSPRSTIPARINEFTLS
jgi:hypothetical protein